MIDTDDIAYLTSENLVEEIQNRLEIIRDATNDVELLLAKFRANRYLTQDEVADMLHCAVKSIPREIPNVHWGRNWLYTVSDVEKFVRTHRQINK